MERGSCARGMEYWHRVLPTGPELWHGNPSASGHWANPALCSSRLSKDCLSLFFLQGQKLRFLLGGSTLSPGCCPNPECPWLLSVLAGLIQTKSACWGGGSSLGIVHPQLNPEISQHCGTTAQVAPAQAHVTLPPGSGLDRAPAQPADPWTPHQYAPARAVLPEAVDRVVGVGPAQVGLLSPMWSCGSGVPWGR